MITKIKTKNREEWKALRHQYIGGSDAASVVGFNPYKSVFSLWAEKTGKTAPFEGNLATDVGTFLEEFIASKFEEISGKKVRRENHSLLNDKYPFAIANVDRVVVGEDAGVECKSTSELNLKNFKNGTFPANYYCQCVHYLGVTEKKKWYLAVLVGNKNFFIYQLTRIPNDVKPEWCEESLYIDDDEIKALMDAEKNFYVYVTENKEPPIDGTKSTADTIAELYPESNEETVDLFAFADELDAIYALKAQIKALEAVKTEKENLIKEYMKMAGKGICEGYGVSWTSSERKTFDSKRFAAENTSINLDPYYNTTSVRTLRINKKKG